jgi:hypothetical protein
LLPDGGDRAGEAQSNFLVNFTCQGPSQSLSRILVISACFCVFTPAGVPGGLGPCLGELYVIEKRMTRRRVVSAGLVKSGCFWKL